MRKRHRQYHDWSTIMAIAICILALLWSVSSCVAKKNCIEAGYADIQHVGLVRYCVGVRDGNTVKDRLHDVRLEQYRE